MQINKLVALSHMCCVLIWCSRVFFVYSTNVFLMTELKIDDGRVKTIKLISLVFKLVSVQFYLTEITECVW